MGVDYAGFSGIGDAGIFAAKIDGGDEGLVFDGAGGEEGGPVGIAREGPCGDEQEKRGFVAKGGGAEEFGETQVVTDQGADFEAGEIEGDDVAAWLVVVSFAGGGERVNLRVTQKFLALGGEEDGLVAAAAVGGARDQATEDVDAAADRLLGKEVVGGAGFIFCNGINIHAEAGGECFREQQQ